jgi:hypothetical protein
MRDAKLLRATRRPAADYLDELESLRVKKERRAPSCEQSFLKQHTIRARRAKPPEAVHTKKIGSVPDLSRHYEPIRVVRVIRAFRRDRSSSRG